MRFGWMMALLMLAAADPALADITARFRQGEGPPIVVQVNDRGDSRMTVTDGVYLSRNGADHMVLTFREGTVVARREDFLALIAEFSGAQNRAAPPADNRVEISEQGSETIGGRTGTIYRIGTAGRNDSIDLVISTDADLAPIGRVFQYQFLPMLAAQGVSPPGLAAAMTDLLSRGALLRFGALFQLEAVDMAPVPASTFELPAAPVSRDVLRARIMGETGR